jgi:hypothetical protein
MKKRSFIMLSLIWMLGTSLQVQAQSSGENLFVQANSLL